MRHIIEDHLFLLLHSGHKIRKLPHDDGVHSEHAGTDHLGLCQLDPLMKEGGGQGNYIQQCHYIVVLASYGAAPPPKTV